MTKAQIFEHLYGMGMNVQEASQVYQKVVEHVMTGITFKVWQFREMRSTKIPHSYAAMTNLMAELKDRHYDVEYDANHMKVVYIAHPVAGDQEGNFADLRRIVANLNRIHDNIVPFVPYYADTVSLDDNHPGDRARGIKNGIFIMGSGVVDEMWLTGNFMSPGMEAERMLAEQLGIPVIDKIGKL
jgi:hypothetical protein